LKDQSLCIDHKRKGMGRGYATSWIVVDGVRKSTTLHRALFYKAFGLLPEVVRHKCDNPRCINLLHMEPGTYADNMQDMRERGRAGDCRNFGESNGRTVLTPEAVAYIRANYVKSSREVGLPALARKFNVGTTQIHRVVKGIHHVRNA
jgi:hypothetical protein